MTPEAKLAFRRDLERAGEATVRAEFYSGPLGTGGEDQRQAVREWLREQEQQREQREREAAKVGRDTYRVAWWTLVAAVIGVLVAVAGVIATVRHP